VTDRLALWDFDGTLAYRPGMWSGCVVEVLDMHDPAHAITLEMVRAGLRQGFPWHSPDEQHPYPGDPERWWEPVESLIANTLIQAGLQAERCADLAHAVRLRFTDPTIAWTLFDDTIETLAAMAEAGWTNAILSNHVPELSALVTGLGLDEHVDRVFTSALLGYDKPHPEIFRHALRTYDDPEDAWMIGDNPVADVAGAEAVGIRAILVRTPATDRTKNHAPGLRQASEMILATQLRP
jgi:putative hydrolase of the HAD superfamily